MTVSTITKAWIIGPLVTLAVTSTGMLLMDLNTHDGEIKPEMEVAVARLAALENLSAQQGLLITQNSRSLGSLATSRALSMLTTGIKAKAAMEAKYGNVPLGQWDLEDQQLYEVAQDKIRTARQELDNGNTTASSTGQ